MVKTDMSIGIHERMLNQEGVVTLECVGYNTRNIERGRDQLYVQFDVGGLYYATKDMLQVIG